MEQEMLGELLGPGVGIRLGNCIIDGKHACQFHVSRMISSRKRRPQRLHLWECP